ncbi:HAD-IB family hydrolase [uncultured Sphingomonas sp.]|uniref:HAD-IB family hydrolase n=1 Tax=uncultured Sphingomonas sp. TaxID=158754 RepID=UPI0026146170|nr:HAD-IB family hydrolase [uncultured Sphingomonas sp.]
MQRIAIYDLDRTITRAPTWTPFLLHAARGRWRMAMAPVAAGAALLHALRLYDRDRLKPIMHRLMLGGALDEAELTLLAEAFAATTDASNIRSGARARMAADRAAGYRIVIATAAHRFYAQAIASRLGVEDLIATEATRDASGRILPLLAGPNCYGAAKLAMIETWFNDQDIARRHAHVRFYSDHPSDAPTFAWADEPVVVSPGKRMAALASAQGWRVERW